VADPSDSLLLPLSDVSSSSPLSLLLAVAANFTTFPVLALPFALGFEAPSLVDSYSSSVLLDSDELCTSSFFPFLSLSSSVELSPLESSSLESSLLESSELELGGSGVGAFAGSFRFPNFSVTGFALGFELSFDDSLGFGMAFGGAIMTAVPSSLSASLSAMNSALSALLLGIFFGAGIGFGSLLDLRVDFVSFESDFAIANRSAYD
jgi:hypothetical protein